MIKCRLTFIKEIRKTEMNTHKFGEIMWFFLDVLVHHKISIKDLCKVLRYYTLYIPCIYCRVFLKNFLDKYELNENDDSNEENQHEMCLKYVWLIHHTVNVKIHNTDSAISLGQYREKMNTYNGQRYNELYTNKNIVRFFRVCCEPVFNQKDCGKSLNLICGTMVHFIDFVFYLIQKYNIEEYKFYAKFINQTKKHLLEKNHTALIMYIYSNM